MQTQRDEAIENMTRTARKFTASMEKTLELGKEILRVKKDLETSEEMFHEASQENNQLRLEVERLSSFEIQYKNIYEQSFRSEPHPSLHREYREEISVLEKGLRGMTFERDWAWDKVERLQQEVQDAKAKQERAASSITALKSQIRAEKNSSRKVTSSRRSQNLEISGPGSNPFTDVHAYGNVLMAATTQIVKNETAGQKSYKDVGTQYVPTTASHECDHEQQCNDLNIRVTSQTNTIDQLRNDNENLKRTASEKVENDRQTATTIAESNTSLRQKDERIKDLEEENVRLDGQAASLVQKNCRINDLENENERLIGEAATSEKINGDKDATNTQLTETIKKLEDALLKRPTDDTVASLKYQIDELERAIKGKDKAHQSLEDQVSGQDKTIQNLQKSLDESEEALRQSRLDHAGCNEDYENQREEIARLASSKAEMEAKIQLHDEEMPDLGIQASEDQAMQDVIGPHPNDLMSQVTNLTQQLSASQASAQQYKQAMEDAQASLHSVNEGDVMDHDQLCDKGRCAKLRNNLRKRLDAYEKKARQEAVKSALSTGNIGTSQLEESVARLTRDNKTHLEMNRKLSKEREDHFKQHQKVLDEVEKLKAERNSLVQDKIGSEGVGLHGKMNELKQKQRDLIKYSKGVENDRDNVRSNNTWYSKELAGLQVEYKQLQDSLKTANEEISNLKKQKHQADLANARQGKMREGAEPSDILTQMDTQGASDDKLGGGEILEPRQATAPRAAVGESRKEKRSREVSQIDSGDEADNKSRETDRTDNDYKEEGREKHRRRTDNDYVSQVGRLSTRTQKDAQ